MKDSTRILLLILLPIIPTLFTYYIIVDNFSTLIIVYAVTFILIILAFIKENMNKELRVDH